MNMNAIASERNWTVWFGRSMWLNVIAVLKKLHANRIILYKFSVWPLAHGICAQSTVAPWATLSSIHVMFEGAFVAFLCRCVVSCDIRSWKRVPWQILKTCFNSKKRSCTPREWQETNKYVIVFEHGFEELDTSIGLTSLYTVCYTYAARTSL